MGLYLLSTKSICRPPKEWWEEFRGRNMCRGCGVLHADLRRRSLAARVEETPDASAINSVNPPGIGIIRADFLELFRAEAQKHLHLGPVLDAAGNILSRFLTFVGERPLPVRGESDSDRRSCEVCGRFVYWPSGDWYVMRSSLTNQTVYETSTEDLAVTEAIRKRIVPGKWKGMWITKLPVRDEPLDGIENFPENYY